MTPALGPSVHVACPGGVEVAVHELGGTVPDPLLLLCHATGFSGRAYSALASVLSRGGFHVLAVDFRGHGDSSVPPGDDYSWQAMAGDLLAVVDHLSPGRPVHAFGHSMGGAVLLLAETERPGLLEAAYLYEPIVLPAGRRSGPDAASLSRASASLAAAARRRRAVFSSREEALWRFAESETLGVLQAQCLVDYVEHAMVEAPDGTVHLKCEPAAEAACFEADDLPTSDSLGALQVPTTVAVGGAGGRWAPSALGVRAAESLGNGRLERHPAFGHLGPLEAPRAVGLSALDAFALNRTGTSSCRPAAGRH